MKQISFLFCILFFISCHQGMAQNTTKAYKDIGEAFFEREIYDEALKALLIYHKRKPGDIDIKKKIGICSYHSNDLDQAIKFLNYVLENEKKTDPNVYYYLGKTNHARKSFKQATRYYKSYLASIKSNHPDRARVKDDIRRCANGIRLTAIEENIIVENMGSNINGPYDDFLPVLSPNYDNRIYFSSVRAGNKGGKRNEKGHMDQKFGRFSSDIFSASQYNGEWSVASPLTSPLNTPRNEILLDFDNEGKVMYFFKGFTRFSGELLVDTFKNDHGELLFFGTLDDPPVQPEEGDRQISFYNDSIMLFSSMRPGGFGGYDIYITSRENGVWTEARNLGPTVNSAYDEQSPFLAKDGRTLYFSSNNSYTSMGGFDIMKAEYNDKTRSWRAPANLAFPVNSPEDDINFKMSKDGLKAYFASNRKEGEGESDLYAAYYKSPQKEQQRYSNPLVFSMIVTEEPEQSTADVAPTANPDKETRPTKINSNKIPVYKIEPVFFTDNNDVISSGNKSDMAALLEALIAYPELHLSINSHSDQQGPTKFDLYYSMKRAEQIADYLGEHGVSRERINIKGCGAAYPIAYTEIDGEPSRKGISLNRRIDFKLHGVETLPIRVTEKEIKVPTSLRNFKLRFFNETMNGLAYKVQVSAIKQMYDSYIIDDYPDAMIESNFGSDVYRYTLGLYQTYSSAEQLRSELENKGVSGAYVVPYINGLRCSRAQLDTFAESFPDLYEYLKHTN